MKELQRRIYTAISKPACDRCQSRTGWHPTDCDKYDCHKLYQKETDAVMDIIFEQRVQGFSDALDRMIRSAETIANDKTQTSAVRLFALDAANEVKAVKEELLDYYKAELEK